MSEFTVLSQADEDDLHAKRLLNIEEKPFKRIQKRLLAPTNPIQEYLRRTPVDTSSNTTNGSGEVVSEGEESTTANGATTSTPQTQDEIDIYLKSLETFTHATLHDFSSLTTSLARLQFLLSSNERERQRYTSQASTITAQHVSIREDTSRLRTRLADAREQLEVRKGYDVLAEKVLWVDGKVGNERAKTREELNRESDKLRSEIEELEREGEELQQQWVDRRHALQDVISEAGRLRRVVRGEPEHIEEDKKDDEESRSEADGDEGEHQKRREEDEEHMLNVDDREREGGTSNAGTPRPIDDGGATPIPHLSGTSGGLTPLPTIQEQDQDSGAMTPHSIAGDGDIDAHADTDGGATPRPAHGDNLSGSSLKHETHMHDTHSSDEEEGEEGEEEEDAQMSEPHHRHHQQQNHQQDQALPEFKVDDTGKDEVSEMDTT